MSLLVGLTGGMGSGKTLAASFFKELGAHIIDADVVCRELVRPGQPAWLEIKEDFGEEILSADQTIDRAKLAEIVFNDKSNKEALEKILHPRVFDEEQRVYQEIRNNEPDAVVVIDAALLIESGNFERMDRVIVVRCDEETQIRRVMDRSSLSREDVQKRIRGQMSLEEKVRKADYVLENNFSIEDFRSESRKLFLQLKAAA